MLKGIQLKNGDTFYYALHTYTSDNKEKYIVMPYCFDSRWHECFEEELMFATKKEAEAKVKELNDAFGV